MQGDDEQSRASARFLASVAENIEAEAENRGSKKPDTLGATKSRYLSFIKPLPSLLTDQERRATPAKNKTTTVPQITANPNKSARISGLISKLDEVAARQQGQPGGVSLSEDPIIKALIDQGEAAVEPLLRVLKTDERLTRSVRFTRDFFLERHIITVGEAAYTALTDILKTDTFVLPNDRLNIETMEGRRELAFRIEGFLSNYGRNTSQQRWYAVLADDKATAEEWNQAAAYIISPIYTYQISPPWVFTSTPVPAQRRLNKIRLQGDSLHSENSPSVTELLSRRMFELAERKAENLPYQNLWIATNLSLALLTWDESAQFSAVTSFQNILESRLQLNANQPQEAGYLRTMMVRLYLKRIEAGDAAALFAYGEWISRMKPEEAGENTIELFKPLWRYASHPAMMAAAKRLFVRTDSPWLPLIDGADRQSFFRARLMEFPLINVKIFRDLALAGLADKTVIGTWERRRTDSVENFYLPVENTFAAVLVGAINAGGAIITEKKQIMNLSETAGVRVCDAYAAELARLDNAPNFEITQTEKERDRAIIKLKNFLSEGGKRFESAFSAY